MAQNNRKDITLIISSSGRRGALCSSAKSGGALPVGHEKHHVGLPDGPPLERGCSRVADGARRQARMADSIVGRLHLQVL